MAGKRGKKSSGDRENLKRGELGPAIVAEVDRLVREEGIAKNEAFRRIAGSTGRSVGTVSVTYYRVTAKKKGSKTTRRTGRPAGVRQRRSTRSVNAALKKLASLIRDQERELEQLRNENATFREVRRLIG